MTLLFGGSFSYANSAPNFCDRVFSLTEPASTVLIPQLYADSEGDNHYLEEIPESKKSNILLRAVARVMDFANRVFSDRRESWPPEFIDERTEVAKTYSDRSKYVLLRKGKVQFRSKDDPIAGTLGVTYARYDEKSLAESKSGAPLEDIPVEKTLGLDHLPRPLDSSGVGIIFELRTYAKDKIQGQAAFPKLLQGAYNLVFSMIKDMPELYDKQILYLYADALSVRFYKQMGFTVNEDIAPIIHDGVTWQVMSVSPKNLEAVVFKIPGFRVIGNLNQPFVAIAPNGQRFRISPRTSFAVDEENVAMKAISMDELEIFPGIFVAPGTQFIWRGSVHWAKAVGKDKYDSDIAVVDSLARPAQLQAINLMVPAGSSVHLNGKGEITSAFGLTKSVEIEELGVTVLKGDSIFVDYLTGPELARRNSEGIREEVTVGPLAQELQLSNGQRVPKGSTVTWVRSPKTNRLIFLRFEIDE